MGWIFDRVYGGLSNGVRFYLGRKEERNWRKIESLGDRVRYRGLVVVGVEFLLVFFSVLYVGIGILYM